MTTTGDIVLVYVEEEPAFFARIEEISADQKPDWYQVRLLVLQSPLAEVVWILRESYINGEPLTMGGQRIRLEKVEGVGEDQLSDRDVDEKETSTAGKVISISERKRG
jgi:hypothetical protein